MENLEYLRRIYQQSADRFTRYFLRQACEWGAQIRGSDAPFYLSILQEVYPNIQSALVNALLSLRTNYSDDDLWVFWRSAIIARARSLYHKALRIFERLGAPHSVQSVQRDLDSLNNENSSDWYQSYYAESARRFADHYRSYVQTHTQEFDTLEAEVKNIFVASDWYNRAEMWTGVVDIVGAIDDFLRIRGYWSDAVHYGQLAVKAAYQLYKSRPDDLPRGLDLVRFQSSLAATYALQGRYREAERFLEEAIEVSHQLNDDSALALVSQFIGLLAEAKGDAKGAERLYRQALERIRQVGHLPSIALTLEQLASLARERGHYKQALNLYKEKLSLDKQAGDAVGMISTLHGLGQLAADTGSLVLARQCHQNALDLAREFKQPLITAEALQKLAHDAYLQEDYETAHDLYSQALEIVRKVGDKSSVADLLRRLAFVAEELGYSTQHLLEESLSISQGLGDYPGMARSLIQLGELYQERDDYARARTFYQRALGIAGEIEDQALVALAWQQLGRLAHEQEDWVEAQRCYQQSLVIIRQLGDLNPLALLLHQLGQVLYQQGHLAQARQALKESLQINTDLGDWEAVAGTLHQLAWIAAEEGNLDEARSLCEQSISILKEIGSPYLEVAQASLTEFSRIERNGMR